MENWDVIVVGAGAAGLFCAGVAGQAGLRVLLLDHSPRLAEKIRISGGGRCNFTNLQTNAGQFISGNPHFCRSALSRYQPQQFPALLQRYGVGYHEKHKGQLFCDRSSEDIIRVLTEECAQGKVQRWQPCTVHSVHWSDGTQPALYSLETDRGPQKTKHLVVATGGLSIPQIGASDFGYRIAQQFGLDIVPTRPALVPLTFDAQIWEPFTDLAGVALPVRVSTGERKSRIHFEEDLLFTHRGLSGPAVLQISSYWKPGAPIQLDLAPDLKMDALLVQEKQVSRKRISNVLGQWLPARLTEVWVERGATQGHDWMRPVMEASDKSLQALAQTLQRWELIPHGTEGYRKAEVTAGGVDTRMLSGQTMESRQPGLYFIGEVVDVTGWLGGYNFQWAWASAYACAQALAHKAGA